MSRLSDVSPLHPVCGYHCTKCTDRTIYTQTEVRTLYCMAVEETDPKESFQAHMKYLSDPSMRMAEIPNKVCRTCGEPLVVDMLSHHEADDLLRACRMIDDFSKELNNWAQRFAEGACLGRIDNWYQLPTSMQHMVSCALFSEIGDWWREDLPCYRASLNTMWRAGISGISMIIFSDLFEQRYAEWLAKVDEEDEADDASDEEEQTEPIRVVIPPITIPVYKTRVARAKPAKPAAHTPPTSPTFWDDLSEEAAIQLCEAQYYDWDVIEQSWFQEHKHLIA